MIKSVKIIVHVVGRSTVPSLCSVSSLSTSDASLRPSVELNPTRQPSRVIAAYLRRKATDLPQFQLNCFQRDKHLIAFWEASWFVRNRTSMRYTVSTPGGGGDFGQYMAEKVA